MRIMFGRNFGKIFLNAMQKSRPNIPYRQREIVKNENISLSYDVNGYVYSKSKSVQLCS